MQVFHICCPQPITHLLLIFTLQWSRLTLSTVQGIFLKYLEEIHYMSVTLKLYYLPIIVKIIVCHFREIQNLKFHLKLNMVRGLQKL